MDLSTLVRQINSNFRLHWIAAYRIHPPNQRSHMRELCKLIDGSADHQLSAILHIFTSKNGVFLLDFLSDSRIYVNDDDDRTGMNMNFDR